MPTPSQLKLPSAPQDKAKAKSTHGGGVNAVVDQIRQGLANGRYVPGQRLVEADLSRTMAVSRGPLREALKLLSSEGLVELVPNRGAIIKRLTRSELNDLFAIRAALESLAAGLAAKNIERGDNRERLMAVMNSVKGKKRLRVDIFQHNQAFHHVVALIGENCQLEQLISRMQFSFMMIQLREFLTGEPSDRSIEEHFVITDAILSGDAKAAEKAMRTHITRAGERCASAPDFLFRPEERI
ncbi:MAG TPA: GntR family transcriptional regulator [Afipia sp.]